MIEKYFTQQEHEMAARGLLDIKDVEQRLNDEAIETALAKFRNRGFLFSRCDISKYEYDVRCNIASDSDWKNRIILKTCNQDDFLFIKRIESNLKCSCIPFYKNPRINKIGALTQIKTADGREIDVIFYPFYSMY